MKFLRSPKGVRAQRSRARHLAYKRRPIGEAPPFKPEQVTLSYLLTGLTGLSPIALRDYIEWLRSQPTREENHDTGSKTKSR